MATETTVVEAPQHEEHAAVKEIPVADAVTHAPEIMVSAPLVAEKPAVGAATKEAADVTEASTAIDVHAHRDVPPKTVPATESPVTPPVENEVVAKAEAAPAASAEAEESTTARPAQGDLLAHAGLTDPTAESSPAHPVVNEEEAADHAKKDASSHG